MIYNPIKVDLEAIKSAVAVEEEAAGWNAIRFFPTSEDDPGQGAARQALDAGAGMVIVAGGDGTVRAVAEIVHESDATLALVPSGTGNLFARNLNLVLGRRGAFDTHGVCGGESPRRHWPHRDSPWR